MIDRQYKYLLEHYTEAEIACMLGGHLIEDGGVAAGTSSGAGQIAGIGTTSAGKPVNFSEPGVSPRDQKKNKPGGARSPVITSLLRRLQPKMVQEECGCMKGKFAGEETFIVPAGAFMEARMARKKGKHWMKYIGEDSVGQEIREYYHKTKGKKPIILQCERTGAMHYAHYGKKK
jgi:hypothetical protein